MQKYLVFVFLYNDWKQNAWDSRDKWSLLYVGAYWKNSWRLELSFLGLAIVLSWQKKQVNN